MVTVAFIWCFSCFNWFSYCRGNCICAGQGNTIVSHFVVQRGDFIVAIACVPCSPHRSLIYACEWGFWVCWKLSAAEQIKPDCCHTPAVVSTLLTQLPVTCPSTTPLHYNFGAARPGSAEPQLTRDLSSQRQQQRPILTMNPADNPGQPPAPPMLHSLRPHKLRRFSGEEGDAEDFVREAKLFLELGPVVDPVGAAWLLGALEGWAKQEMLSMGADEVNTPGKIFASKTNAVQAVTLSPIMLRDTFAGGLHPVSLKRDIRRYIRETVGATFADVTREALRWMREDSCPDTTAEQLQAVASNDSLHRLEAQIAALSTETASLKQQLQHQGHYRASPSQGNEAGPPPDRRPVTSGLLNLECWWYQRRSHVEARCPSKRQYQQRRRGQREEQLQGNF